MKTTEWIIPATDLQTDLATILERAKQHPLIILDKGRPKVYVISVDAFDAVMEELQEAKSIIEAYCGRPLPR